jgi:VanZ family protein
LVKKGALSGVPFVFEDIFCRHKPVVKSSLLLQKNPLKKTLFFFFAALAWLLISTWLLTLPGNKFPQENWMDKIGVDKMVHIVMFALLVILWSMALGRPKLFLPVAFLALAYGIAMEFVQRYCIVNRSFDVWDIVADAAGCVLGYYAVNRYLKRKQRVI